MDLKCLLETAAATITDSEVKEKMRAAMYLGARLALEAAIADGSYVSNCKELLKTLNQGAVVYDATPQPEAVMPPAPLSVMPEDKLTPY